MLGIVTQGQGVPGQQVLHSVAEDACSLFDGPRHCHRLCARAEGLGAVRENQRMCALATGGKTVAAEEAPGRHSTTIANGGHQVSQAVCSVFRQRIGKCFFSRLAFEPRTEGNPTAVGGSRASCLVRLGPASTTTRSYELRDVAFRRAAGAVADSPQLLRAPLNPTQIKLPIAVRKTGAHCGGALPSACAVCQRFGFSFRSSCHRNRNGCIGGGRGARD